MNDSRDNSPTSEQKTSPSHWKRIVARYQTPANGRAIWQLVNTLVPYGMLWYLMYLSLSISIWLTIPLALLAGGFLVRIFIIFHDCGHGSFFKSRTANEVLGIITGLRSEEHTSELQSRLHLVCRL